MKKFFSALVLVGFFVVLALPLMVSAQEAPKECCVLKRAIELEGVSCSADDIAASGPTAATECGSNTYCADSGPKWGMFCLMNTFYSITDWIFVIMVAIAGLLIIIGAFILLTSAGTPEKISSGRGYIMYAAIGLIVGLLSKAVPALVKMISGM